jgi:hypothetical protein
MFMSWGEHNQMKQQEEFILHQMTVLCFVGNHEGKLILTTSQSLLLHNQWSSSIFLHSSYNFRGNGRISHRSKGLIVSLKSNLNFKYLGKRND